MSLANNYLYFSATYLHFGIVLKFESSTENPLTVHPALYLTYKMHFTYYCKHHAS